MKNKLLIIFLILVLILGIFLRFYDLDKQILQEDEPTSVIAAMKFFHSSFGDAVSYSPASPPFGRMILGLPSLLINADYGVVTLTNPMVNIFNFKSYDAISKNYIAMRLVLAFVGILCILCIYLISKDLFGKKAALWSAIISAISFDLIIWSRILYMGGFVIFFSLGTLLFFIKYIKSKKYIYLGLTYLFLFFAVGSHHVQPWFLIPVLIICQFIFNKNFRENVLVSIGYLICFGLMWLIYTSFLIRPVREAIDYTYGGSSQSFISLIFSNLNFNYHNLVFGFLLRNNYVLSLVSLICLFLFFKLIFKKKLFGKLKLLFVSKDLKLIILLLFFISFLCLGITILGNSMRQLLFLFIPLYIYSGFVIEKITKKKVILFLIILLILVTIIQGMLNFPSGAINYTNFGISKYNAFSYDEKLDKNVLDFLDSLGNPYIMTNHVNTLIFYKGEKSSLILSEEKTVSGEELCSYELFDLFKQSNLLMLYNGPIDENGEIKLSIDKKRDGPYFCYLLEQVELKQEKIFADNLILYRFI